MAVDPNVLDSLRGVSLNRKLLDHALRHAHYLERFKSGQVRKIVALLNEDVIPDLVETLRQRLENIATRGPGASVKSTQRLRDMIIATGVILQVGLKTIGEKFVGDMKEFALTEARWQQALIRKVAPIELNFIMPNVGTLNSIVASRPVQGVIIRDIFKGVGARAQTKIREQINIGLAAGETVPQMMTRVMGVAQNNYADGVPGTMRRQAEAAVRTVATHVSAETRNETFLANEDLLRGHQFVATLDEKTSAVCIANDGKFFPIGESHPLPPLHYNCRSQIVGVVKSWKELGIPGLNELPPSTRASMNGQVSEKLSYGDWLRTQPKEFVEDVMQSKARASLFLQNKLDVAKFVDNKGRWLSLDALKKIVDSD